jgi:hypothetical protein
MTFGSIPLGPSHVRHALHLEVTSAAAFLLLLPRLMVMALTRLWSVSLLFAADAGLSADPPVLSPQPSPLEMALNRLWRVPARHCLPL